VDGEEEEAAVEQGWEIYCCTMPVGGIFLIFFKHM